MTTLIHNVNIVNEGTVKKGYVLINGEFIQEVNFSSVEKLPFADKVINGSNKYLFPGLIDDQVHFREPGLTHKGEIYTEAKAAVAGGITSFMEMPNTVPQTTSQELLENKYARASEVSLANYSFYMGATNSNLNEVLKTDERNVCGVKIFMGSSTGDMLVDNKETLKEIFANVKTLVATHCEDDVLIKNNLTRFKDTFGNNINVTMHGDIRSREACYASSSMAVELATKYNTQLHVLHISTKEEIALFSNLPLRQKHITAEACVHHLWFCNQDYVSKGNFIKWNPAIKNSSDREAIIQAVKDNKIDVIATDHAPHSIEEKNQNYLIAPSGGPLVQHSLNALLEMYHRGIFSLELIAQKTAHSVADLFKIDKRGYIRSGYYADLVLVDLAAEYIVTKANILYKCAWSPFEGTHFHSTVDSTFVNGNCVFERGVFNESQKGKRLLFNR